MNLFTDKVRYLTNLLRYSSQKKVEPTVKLERNVYVNSVFEILSWNDPYLTWTTFLTINFLFWLVVRLELRLLGIIFLTALMLFIYDSLRKGDKIAHSPVILPEELSLVYQLLQSLVSMMFMLRKESPSLFCFTMCLLFLCMSFVAKNLSGILLLYLTIVTTFFMPLGYIKLPSNIKENIRITLKSIYETCDNNEVKEDDLLPIIKLSNFEENDGESITNESVTNSLISGVSSMPSFMDTEDDDHEILEDELLPSKNKDAGFADLSSDSENEFKEIRFKSSHFNRELSSSSDDTSKSEDFNLTAEEVDKVGSSFIPESFVPDFVLKTLQSQKKTATKTAVSNNSSSESDFELVDADIENKE